MSTVNEIQALSYRELQKRCKQFGLPAKGKADELRGNLILNLQAENRINVAERPSTSPVAEPRPQRTPPRPSVAVTPVTGKPVYRPAIDDSILKQAIGTPLPVSPVRPQTFATGRRKPAAGGKLPYVFGALTAALLAFAFAVLLPYCQQHQCVYEAQQALHSATDWSLAKTGDVAASVNHFGGDAFALAQRRATEAIIASHNTWRRTQEGARASTYAAWEKYQAFLRRVWMGDSESGDGAESALQGGVFSGAFNAAVLPRVLRADSGLEWDTIRDSLEDVWTGGYLAENEKANAILFACGSTTACSACFEELSVVAPHDATMTLTASELRELSPGSLQARLAAFLAEQPRGVVVIGGAIDRLQSSLLSVLSNAMSEGGALQRDGLEVPTTTATFFYCWEAPQAVMQEDSAAALSMAAKSALHVSLRSREDSERAAAVAESFRRRIDLVAPMAD